MPPSIDHTPTLEIIQKELAAHKEMVAELRDQLKEKEAEFQVRMNNGLVVVGTDA